ncbi:Rrf2 family transcriptional regulator [Microbacterium paludicola]|uniref:Rrf2 family transcriptional regulator n=1 Tax=Microbacterium paludicola TaxID=300019 RepID=A0A4Y9FNX5_9MICO|nr:Rrf2 family transcriptional regulator [Microbacterium paludicola]MBF0817515.1 Rrf2 family transcriptional regulator [Microbacterium paludicola]TFU30915.1 Rrf2 family transcriptional regulator [Microbacterium paludicola]
MRISARADYAVRAVAQLAAQAVDEPVSAELIAAEQDIPHRFLEGILTALRRAGIIISQRGARGGHRLARPASEITVADVIRAVDGPLVWVRDARPSDLEFTGAAAPLLQVWVALRANVRAVLESVTVADLAAGRLPSLITSLTEDDAAWTQP